MNEPATRKDIDEVISVIRDLVDQFDNRFSKIEDEILNLNNSHTRLLNTR